MNQLFTIYLLCVNFIVLVSKNMCLQEKLCEIKLIYFLLMTLKRMKKSYISVLRTNMSSLKVRLKEKKNETRNYHLNDLMSEKYKKNCKYLNYVKHLIILFLIVTFFCFNFCICFISWYPCWYYEFCSRNKNLAITAGIKKV